MKERKTSEEGKRRRGEGRGGEWDICLTVLPTPTPIPLMQKKREFFHPYCWLYGHFWARRFEET